MSYLIVGLFAYLFGFATCAVLSFDNKTHKDE